MRSMWITMMMTVVVMVMLAMTRMTMIMLMTMIMPTVIRMGSGEGDLMELVYTRPTGYTCSNFRLMIINVIVIIQKML